jgi:RHS repeat-associated protein
MVRSGASSYYEQDGLSSVTSLSGSMGALANSYTYDTFGNLAASTGMLGNPFQYTGREYDPETGLRYYRARYYDPSIGRFTSQDPIGFRGGINFYSYVKNQPSNLTDPSGLVSLDKSCDCNWSRGDLLGGAGLALAAATRISDPKLRDCIINKLSHGVIKCGGTKCDKEATPDKNGLVLGGWAPPWGNTIHICKTSTYSLVSIACILIHEFTHTCRHPLEGKPKWAENQAFPGLCN